MNKWRRRGGERRKASTASERFSAINSTTGTMRDDDDDDEDHHHHHVFIYLFHFTPFCYVVSLCVFYCGQMCKKDVGSLLLTKRAHACRTPAVLTHTHAHIHIGRSQSGFTKYTTGWLMFIFMHMFIYFLHYNLALNLQFRLPRQRE